jgi:hypothetical protein
MIELNHEILRKQLVEMFEEFVKKKKLSPEMKKFVKDYEDYMTVLDDALNNALGFLDAVDKKEVEGKEAEQFAKEILEELRNKSYLCPSE